MSLDFKQITRGIPKADVVSERTAAAGVTIDGVLAKDGFIQLVEQAGDPVAPAVNNGILYVKEDTGEEELFFRDSSGNVSQITPAGGVSQWDLFTNDIVNNNPGNVGVGPGVGAGLVDEQFHVAKAVDGDFVAALLENSQANVGGSTNETVQLRFGFGGNNDVALILVGKLDDYFGGAAQEDSFMAFSTDRNGTLTEAMRIFDTGEVNIGGTSKTASLAITVTDVNNNVSLSLGTISGDAILSLASQSSDDSVVEFRGDTPSPIKWMIGRDGADSEKFKIASGSAFSTDTIFAIDRTTGNVGVGGFSSATIAEKLHVAESVDNGDAAVLIENSFTNTASSINETASLKFGFGSINTAGLIQVGKIDDFTSVGTRDSFMGFSILINDSPSEGFRILEGAAGVPHIAIGSTAPDTSSLVRIFGGFLKVQSTGLSNITITGTTAANLAFVASSQGMNVTFDGTRWSVNSGGGNISGLHVDRATNRTLVGLTTSLSADAQFTVGGAIEGLPAIIRAFTTTNGALRQVLELSVSIDNPTDGFGGFVTCEIKASGTLEELARFSWERTDGANDSGNLFFETSNAGTSAEVLRMTFDGNVGVGDFSTNAVDEKLHVAEDVDNGDAAVLIENSFTNTASSINETASLKFGFGGINTAGLIRVGKIGDFDSTGARDSSMTFSVLGNDVVLEGIRILGESAQTPTGTVRVEIGATPAKFGTGVLQVVSERTAGADFDMVIENKTLSSTRLGFIRSGLSNLFIQASSTKTFTFGRIGGTTGLAQFRADDNCVIGGFGLIPAGSATLQLIGNGRLQLSPQTGDASIGFGINGSSDQFVIFRDDTDSALIIARPGVSVVQPQIYMESNAATGKLNRTAIGTNDPLAQFHVSVDDNISGSSNFAIFVDYRQALADLPAVDTPALISKWRFGSAVAAKDAAVFNVGKTEDYSVLANESAFISWEIADSGILTEAIRHVGGSSVRTGVGDFSSFAINEKLHVAEAVSSGDAALLIENSEPNATFATSETASLKFGFGGVNTAGLIQVGKTSDFVSVPADRDSFMKFSILLNNVVLEGVRISSNNGIPLTGIGDFTSSLIDEKLHVREDVDNGDAAILIENSFTNTASSINETASLRFGFGGINTAGLIQVGKKDDFTSGANRDSFMGFSILVNDLPQELFRITENGAGGFHMAIGTILADSSRVRIFGGSLKVEQTSGQGNITILGSTEAKLSFGKGIVDFNINFDGTRLNLNNSGGGIEGLHIEDANNRVTAGDTNGIAIDAQFNVLGTLDLLPASFWAATITVNNAPLRALQLNATSSLTELDGFGPFIQFTIRPVTTIFELARIIAERTNSVDNSGNILFETSNAGTSAEVLRMTFDGNVGVGDFSTNAVDEKLHVAEDVDNGDAAVLIENSFTNTAASVDETASLEFGFGTVNTASRIQVGKADDFTTAAQQEAFMKFEVSAGAAGLTEVLRIEGTTSGVSKLSFHASTPIAKPTITGSRAGNAALADILTQLASYGLIIDSTTA